MKIKPAILALIAVVSLVFRLYLTDKAWHVDMLSNAAWGEEVYGHGPKKFYDNNIWTYSWPTQLPLINSVYGANKNWHIEILGRLAFTEHQLNKLFPGEKVWWLSDFVHWFGYGKINDEIPFQIGYMVTMKLLPILADLGLAWLIWQITKKPIYGIIYLFSPFSWYVSSLWGQYDQLGVLLSFLAIWLVNKKTGWTAPALLMLAVLIKPTAIILIPYFGYLFFRTRRRKLPELAVACILPLVIFWFTTAPYTHKNPFEFARYDLTRIVFEKAEPRVSVNSFNFWRIFIGNKAVNSTSRLAGLTWQIWGYLIFAGLNLWAIRNTERHKGEQTAVWAGVFLVSTGGWLFVTGMLERYLFAGIVSGLILAGLKPQLLKYWIVMSVIFWINLYYHWWVPNCFSLLKQLLQIQEDLFTRVLSGLNLLLFWLMVDRMHLLPRRKPESSQK
jgi:hypothetical protein